MKSRVWNRYDQLKAAEKAARPIVPEVVHLRPRARYSRPDLATVMMQAFADTVTKREPEVPGAVMLDAAKAAGYSLAESVAALSRLVHLGALKRGERGHFRAGKV